MAACSKWTSPSTPPTALSSIRTYRRPRKRWVPFVDEVVRASIDEKIEGGRIDFVDDLANIAPAVLTLAMMGVPLKKWKLYCEPAHANVYTPSDSPAAPQVLQQSIAMGMDLLNHLLEIRENPRPGLVDALARLKINGESAPDLEVAGTQFREGERLWLSWAMANRDPEVCPEPNRLLLDRKNNRHFSFGLGIHRCIGSNVARTVFKSMLTAVLDRMPDYRCEAEGTVHYQTIGVIQGMQHLPATFTPGKRLGPGIDETLGKLQRVCEEQGVARPISEYKEAAVIGSG